jgi:hypothetical protein
MAEESMKNKGGSGKFLTSLGKGLNTDVSPETQPEGTYRWALNAVAESEEGNIGFLTNEEGNYTCGSIDADWAIIGHVYIGDDEAIIFQAPKDGSVTAPNYGQGRISRIKSDCSIVNVITAGCLNFKLTHQIQATYRVRKGCEIAIYFTDDYNKVGYINIDALEDYLAEGQEQYIADNPNTYMNDAYDGSGNPIWDCDKLSLFPDFSMPCINFVRIDESGNLISGVYQFAIQYLDQDLNESRWTTITQPIPIYRDALTEAYSIKGDHPSQVNPDGTIDFVQTNKSIVLEFTNLDISYSFIRVAVIPSTQGIGAAAGAYIVDTIPFSGTSVQYIFDSYDQNQVTLASLDQITIPRQSFERAKTITQIDNRLILGNVEEAEIDHTELTKAALDIEITYVTRELGADDPNIESVQSGRYYFDYRSYMRDEIYAFGIVWVFKDGTESPVYHIPGREKNKKADGTDMISVAGSDPNVPHATGYNAAVQAQHNRELPVGTDWDSTIIWDNTSVGHNMNVDHYVPADPGTGNIERWEVYNTAVREQIITESNPTNVPNNEERKFTKGQLAYYECRNSEYPDIRDCDGIPIFPHTDLGGGNYQMHKVRHHKMPDTTLEPHFYGNTRIGLSRIGYMGDNPHDFNNSYDRSYIVTLGIEVDNIVIPQSIADRVQGYRIVKAIANEGDKTVIDKGIIFNIHYAFNFYNGKNVPTTISGCSYAFQGNRFNKQLGEFACAHVSFSGYLKPAKYNENPTSIVWPQPAGWNNIAADNYYCFEFNQINEPYGGYVLRHELNGTSNCFASNAEQRDKQSFMAPLIVNEDWQNWYGALTSSAVDSLSTGINNLRNPDGPIILPPPLVGQQPERVRDLMYKGVGYPLGNWGWYTPPGVGGSSPENLYIDDSDGVNIGYETPHIVYPNSPMGYHGPLSKFKKIETATYVKTERVLIGYTQNIICNNACCPNDVIRDNNPAHLNGLGEFVPGRYDGGSIDPPGGSTYVYSRMAYLQSAVPYTNPSQTFDPANNMQWERWSNPCSYQPDTGTYTIPSEWATPNTPGTGHRGQSIWQNQSARYSKPLQNVRISEYVKLDPYTEEIYFLENILGSGGIFSNHSQQEVLLMGFSWDDLDPTTNQRVYWAWPWPGNNYSRGGAVANYDNYTRIPFDHAYSRFNCHFLYDRYENTQYAEPPYTTAITGPPEQLDSADPYHDDWYDLDGNPYEYPLNGLGTTYYVSVKKNAYDAYGSIFNLSYTITHNCVLPLEESADEIYGGDSFISRFAFKQTQEGAKVSKPVVDSTKDGCVDNAPRIQPLNEMTPQAPVGSPPYGPFLNIVPFENLTYSADTRLSYANFNHIVQYWVESYINTELRLGNDVEGERIYPYHFEGNSAQQGTLAFVDDSSLQDQGAPYQDLSQFETYPNYYSLNEDYNKAAVESTFAPLPLQFDYCTDCNNRHPHRISYSEVSIDNEQSDAYRNFLTGNFRDIPGNRGEVWNIWTSNNALYIHTAESLWRVDPSRQMLQPEENEATIYIGTGAFFSNPPREIAQSELGYLGSRSQWATMLTETGVIWPDEQQGHIYMQQEGPGDIGAKGMKAWFESNMPISIYQQYKDIYGVNFPLIDNPANPIGAGYTAVFDSEYKRYILTKRDYKLIGDFADPASPFYGSKSIEIDPIRNEWVLSQSECECYTNPTWQSQADDGTYAVNENEDGECVHTWEVGEESFEEITPCEKTKLTGNDNSIICRTCGDNALVSPIMIQGEGDGNTKLINNLNEIFECDSWTVSYSLAPESWTSFHSYIPNYYIGMRHYFYTYMPHLLPIYRHELNGTRTNYQTFYGCTDPFIIDFINNDGPLNTNVYDTVRYYTNVSYYDTATREYVDDRYITFDRAWLYNSYQTTGELTLEVKNEVVSNMMVQAVNQQSQTSLVKRKDRVWFLNHFRDIARDRTQATVPTLFTNDWTSLSTTPYLDKVINPLAINNTKAWYENQPLKDRYLQVRLFFNNLAGTPASGKYKMTTNFILSSAQQSFR